MKSADGPSEVGTYSPVGVHFHLASCGLLQPITWAVLLEEAQDGLDYLFVPSVGIDHCMIEGPVGPVGMEVILDESGTFTVDCIDQHLCIGLFLTFRN